MWLAPVIHLRMAIPEVLGVVSARVVVHDFDVIHLVAARAERRQRPLHVIRRRRHSEESGELYVRQQPGRDALAQERLDEV